MSDIKTYEVSVQGFPPAKYIARSPGKARAAAWRNYGSTFDVTFRLFLGISSCRLVPNPPGIGERIMVGGKPATRVIGYGQYVHFMRDDSDVILCSHPADVEQFGLQPRISDHTP